MLVLFCAYAVLMTQQQIIGDEIIDETDNTFEHTNNTMNLDAINQQQQGSTGTAARQTFDLSRLKLLNANAKEDKLSKEEASAVVRYN
jgi:hypothetical protein